MAARRRARAPDGYTLLMGTSSTLTFAPLIYKKVGYDPEKDFAPISLIAAIPFVLVVNPSLNVSSVKELIALLKSKPGQLSYASGGIGALHHVYSEMFKRLTGTDMNHVPYRGGGPAMQDVVAGHVPIMFADVGFDPRSRRHRQGQGAGGHDRDTGRDACRTCRPWSKPACLISRPGPGNVSLRRPERRSRS